MRSRSTNNKSQTPERMTGALARAAISRKKCFGKSSNCPSSDDLLRLCDERRAACELRLSPAQRAALQQHLATCDFCAAELQLLAAHSSQPSKPYPSTPAQMPVHLYALARALLTRPPHDGAPLAEIMQAPIAPQLADAV